MSRHSLTVPTHKLNHKCVGKEAICVFIEALTANGPLNEPHNGEETPEMVDCISNSKDSGRKNVTVPTVYSDIPAVEHTRRPSPKDFLVVAFNFHVNALLESAPPSLLREKLIHFMEYDWHDIVKVLEGGEIDSVEDVKAHWRQIELLVGDTNDILLQEGALLLSLVLGETDLVSEFYASVEDMEMCISEGMRDKSLPNVVRSLLPKFKTSLIQCRKEAQKVLESGMQGDKRTDALVSQRKKLFAQFEAFVNQTPQSRYRDLFKRQCYKVLMSLQNCQRSPLKAPQLAAFSLSLRAVAANTGDSNLFGKLFHVIYTTLRDANESPTRQIASILAAQCNEILSQHGHLLSPLVIEVLKTQGKAAVEYIAESVSERSAPESEGWLSQLVDAVSSAVHEWWVKPVEGKDLPAAEGPVTAFEIIASVDPALAGTIDDFLKFVRAILVGVPLKAQQPVALQCLLESELHIVDHLKKNCEGATKGELEMEIKREFTKHVNSLWPSIVENLDPEISKALNKKYAETFKTLTRTTVLESLIRRVGKLTLDPRVQALASFVIMLNSFVSGVEGLSHTRSLSRGIWRKALCPTFTKGENSFYYLRSLSLADAEVNTCMERGSETEQILQIWRDLYTEESLCLSRMNRTQATVNYDTAPPTRFRLPTDLDIDCTESFMKRLINFHDETIIQHCQLGRTEDSPKTWIFPTSNHPSGSFIYCEKDGTQIPPTYPKLDTAQAAQLQCRRLVDPLLTRSRIELTDDDIPPSLRMENAAMRYVEDGDGTLLMDFGKYKWMAPCPKNLPSLEGWNSKARAHSPLSKTLPSYILGGLSPHMEPGEQSTIEIGGRIYGLYEETLSGVKPARNTSLDPTTTLTPPSTQPPTQPTTQPTTQPPTQPTTQPTTQPPTQPTTQPSTQPSTLGFSFPNYPSLVVSNSSAVGPVRPQEHALSHQTLGSIALWLGGISAASAVALCVYHRCNRPHIPTCILLQRHANQSGAGASSQESYPLNDMRVSGAALTKPRTARSGGRCFEEV